MREIDNNSLQPRRKKDNKRMKEMADKSGQQRRKKEKNVLQKRRTNV